MGKRGRKTLFSHEQRIDVLKKHKIFNENGILKKGSDQIWVAACQELNHNVDLPNKIKEYNLHRWVARTAEILLTLKQFHTKSEEDSEVEGAESCAAPIKQACDIEEKILSIQCNALYKPIIKEISVSPFSIFHWTIEAIDFVIDLSKKEIIHFYFGQVGSFCEKFVAPDGSCSGTIFLSALGIKIKEKFIPICQVSSEDISI